MFNPNPKRPCPRCGNAVHRSHRTERDRLASGLVKALTFGRDELRRYRCRNCSWHGLRRARRDS